MARAAGAGGLEAARALGRLGGKSALARTIGIGPARFKGGCADALLRHSFSARNRISRGARKPEKLPGSSIGSLPQ